ncbi:ABC transporter substrate-binding protein [Dechloromonas sp. H13]|uniref:ABC transporter substrate-binding protein n=1 Tax=Dechloromonas sp. H13 TaxID=2570193 RepID=UPI001291DE4C|nr:ABC transporter substrate-binding protein [Dechloromonas sp. H13]
MIGKSAFRGLLAAAALVMASLATAETGVTDGSITIGQSVPLSGPAQELGIEMQLGAKLYFDQINAQGGVHGRKIKLLSLDDGYEPDRATANTRELIDKNDVFALFGYVGTPTSLAALQVSNPAGVPFFGAFTGAEALRLPFNRLVFNVRASYGDETEKIVEQFTSLNVKRIAVFYQNDAYGKAGLSGVEKAMAKRNLQLVATATVERNSSDVAAAVKTLIPAKPDMVVMVTTYKSSAAFINAMRAAGSGAQFYTVSFVGSRALANELGPDGAGVGISQVVPFPWSRTLPVVRDYQKLLAASGTGRDVSFTSLEGYIAAKVFVEGLRRSGKELTRDKFISAMENLRNFDAGGFAVNFTPGNHNGSTFVELTIIRKDGSFLR